MYLEAPEVPFNPYEDESSCWNFYNEFIEFGVPEFKLEYIEPEYPVRVDYPASPEALSPGSTYDQLPMMCTSPTCSYDGSEMPMVQPQQQIPAQHCVNDIPQFNPHYMPIGSLDCSPLVYADTPVGLSPHGSISSMSSYKSIQSSGMIGHPQIPSHIPVAYPVVGSKDKAPVTPVGLGMKIQSMEFHPTVPMVNSMTDKFLKLWMPLDTLNDARRNTIMQRAIEKDLDPNVVHTHLQMFPNNDWPVDCPGELRELPVIDIEIGGSALDTKSKHIKRPLNSFMIYRKAQTQRARINAQRRGIKINHQTISSIVGLLWQTESGRVHEFFSEAAGVEKFLHSEEHPNYKFKPRKKSKLAVRD